MENKHKPYGPYEKYFKRPIDLICGLIAVIVFSWLYIILIILGTIFMRGNPFFTQERPGKDEKIFKLIKFRTMDNRKDKNGKLLPDEVRLNKSDSCSIYWSLWYFNFHSCSYYLCWNAMAFAQSVYGDF